MAIWLRELSLFGLWLLVFGVMYLSSAKQEGQSVPTDPLMPVEIRVCLEGIHATQWGKSLCGCYDAFPTSDWDYYHNLMVSLLLPLWSLQSVLHTAAKVVLFRPEFLDLRAEHSDPGTTLLRTFQRSTPGSE